MLGRDSEDEIWSRFVFQFLIWPQDVTLVRWTQSSGPLCLWQCLVFIVWSFCRSCSILENSSVYWKNWSGCNGLSIISTNKLGHLLLRHLQADVILFAINFPSKKWAPLEQKNAFRLPQQLYRLCPPNPLLLILNWEPHGTNPGFDSQMTSSFLRRASWMLSLNTG